jgi:hypothetical protein
MEEIFSLVDMDDPDIKFMIYDIFRMLTLQISTQIMFTVYNPSVSLFNMTFLLTTLFLCISICMFWLIVKKMLVSDVIEKKK